MRELILRTISTLCFDRWPFMYAGFCHHCDFYYQGVAWSRRSAHRKCDEIDRLHQQYHANTHHPIDEIT